MSTQSNTEINSREGKVSVILTVDRILGSNCLCFIRNSQISHCMALSKLLKKLNFNSLSGKWGKSHFLYDFIVMIMWVQVKQLRQCLGIFKKSLIPFDLPPWLLHHSFSSIRQFWNQELSKMSKASTLMGLTSLVGKIENKISSVLLNADVVKIWYRYLHLSAIYKQMQKHFINFIMLRTHI
jgi:hypothetical protein